MGVFKKKGEWWIDYYYLGRRYRKKIGKSKRQAEIILSKIKTQIVEGTYLDIKRNEKIRFEEMAELFLKNYSQVNKKSWKRDHASIKNLNSFFKGRYIYEINNLDVENYKRKRIADGVKHATINRELACLKTIFNKAIEWNILKTEPPKIKLYKENNQRVRYLTEEEYKKILSLCDERLRSIVKIAVNTGMRENEIAKLKWKDVDLKERMITLWDTKNKEKSVINMNEIVFDTLLGIKINPESEYVFPGKNGKGHISPSYIYHSFKKIVKKAEINDFTFHDLRHTFASWLVMSGVDLKTVQELMRHKDFRMTLRYAHLSPEHKKTAVEILAEKQKSIQEIDTIWTPEVKFKNKEISKSIVRQ